MGSSLVDVGPGLAVALVALTVLAVAAGRLSGLGQERPVVVAVVRATVQLAAVAAVLLAVVDSLLLSGAFVLLMVSVAAVTAAGRVTGVPVRAPRAARRVLSAAVPVVVGAAPVVAVILASGTVPLSGTAVIPIAGIVVGGAMTASSLTGCRLRDELTAGRGEVEAALALGLSPDPHRRTGHAAWRVRRSLLGGGSPVEAGAAQLLVLVGLLAAELLAVWTVTELVAWGVLLDDVPR